MIDRIKKSVILNGDKIAYVVDNKNITYKQLWEKAKYYAKLLQKQGVDPVIIYGDKNIDIIISILACLIANRAYVPIGCCMPKYRIEQIIKMTKSSLILSNNKIEFNNIDCFKLEELEKYENNNIKENNNEIAYIIFTSGSTGIPKGVPISKDNLNNFVEWISNLKPLCDYKNINVLNQASFSFDLSVADLYYSLCNGHTLISYNSDINENYNLIFDLMLQIDVAVMTPTFMKLCLLNKEFNQLNFPKFKCVYFCGEKLDSKLVQKIYNVFPNLKIINAYGPSEATSAVSAILITKEMIINSKLLPVGDVKNFATDIEILDDEIILKGKSVFNGYLSGYSGGYYKTGNINCYKTGDIGYIEDGKLYCKGRKDSQIKYKGYRIEINDIEYNLNLIDEIIDCAVIPKYNEDLTVKLIKAFVVVKNNKDEKYIREELEKYIPSYMIPNIIKIMDKLPINQNGKIDRKALNEL